MTALAQPCLRALVRHGAEAADGPAQDAPGGGGAPSPRQPQGAPARCARSARESENRRAARTAQPPIRLAHHALARPPAVSKLCSTYSIMPESIVDKWRVFAEKFGLDEGKAISPTNLTK